MDIILKRSVKTECYRLLMDICKKGKREDIISVLILASENNGYITPELICKHLLANRPLKVGEMIVQRCTELGLLRKYNENISELTDLAKIAVEEKSVFLKESGLYRIIYSFDPLLKSPLIDCIPDKNKDAKDDQKEEFDKKICAQLENRSHELKNKENEEIFIEKIELFGRKIKQKVNLDLICSLLQNGKIILRLNGDYESKLDSPEISHTQMRERILAAMKLTSDWDETYQCLKRGFNELSPKHLSTFKITLQKSNLSIGSLGEFNESILKDISIIPRTLEDAQQWSLWLLKNEISGYLKPIEYETITQKIKQKFTGFELDFPSQKELAEIIRLESSGNLPSTYWYLKAPLDLVEVM